MALWLARCGKSEYFLKHKPEAGNCTFKDESSKCNNCEEWNGTHIMRLPEPSGIKLKNGEVAKVKLVRVKCK